MLKVTTFCDEFYIASCTVYRCLWACTVAFRDSSTASEAGISAVQRRLADSDRQLSQARLALEQVQSILPSLTCCWDEHHDCTELILWPSVHVAVCIYQHHALPKHGRMYQVCSRHM